MADSQGHPVYAAMGDDASLSNEELIQLYERGCADLREAVAGLTAEEAVARPIPGKWSVLEVVCHMVDCDQFGAERLKRTIALEKPLHIGIDPTTYSASLGYQQRELGEELQLFELTRRQIAKILRRLPERVWQRQAVHTETGLVTVRQLLLHPTRHLHHHLPFIAEKRRALGKEESLRECKTQGEF